MGANLGLSGAVVRQRLERLRSEAVVRRVGPVFDAGRLGYATALVAGQVPPERLEAVAAAAAELGGVSHNYERDHAYNLWFTLTRGSLAAVRQAAAELAAWAAVPLHVLPAERTYKVRVAFAPRGAATAGSPAASAGPHRHDIPPPPAAPVRLDAADRALVRRLQDGLELTEAPLAAVAAELGRTSDDVVATLRRWSAQGVLRRFGAVVAHRRLGVRANGLVLLDVPPGRIDAAARVLAAQADVTHCFGRPPLPELGCGLYAMLHGSTREAVRARAEALAEQVAASAWHVLFSTRSFRRAPLRYFEEAPAGG